MTYISWWWLRKMSPSRCFDFVFVQEYQRCNAVLVPHYSSTHYGHINATYFDLDDLSLATTWLDHLWYFTFGRSFCTLEISGLMKSAGLQRRILLLVSRCNGSQYPAWRLIPWICVVIWLAFFYLSTVTLFPRHTLSLLLYSRYVMYASEAMFVASVSAYPLQWWSNISTFAVLLFGACSLILFLSFCTRGESSTSPNFACLLSWYSAQKNGLSWGVIITLYSQPPAGLRPWRSLSN